MSGQIIELFPRDYFHYFEPFLGGGAIFFAIAGKLKNIYLSDANPELITTYKQVQCNVNLVIDRLKIHEKNHCKKYYYHIRGQHGLKRPLDLAARMIYLNNACYNGLYRVNSKGHFNVAVGNHKYLHICDEDNLRSTSCALKKSKIESMSFADINPIQGAFIYCDPPYHQSFVQYTPQCFSEHQQIILRNKMRSWEKCGVRAMVSNSNTSFIRSLYRGFKIKEIKKKYLISCKPQSRPTKTELIITNY